jgi:hypothetical protein
VEQLQVKICAETSNFDYSVPDERFLYICIRFHTLQDFNHVYNSRTIYKMQLKNECTSKILQAIHW